MRGRVNAISTFKGLVADLRYKTTCCFHKNDGSLCTKRRIVSKKQRLTLHKTTCCFQKNNGSLCTKRRIVSKKTTAHFAQNDVLFSKTHESGRQPSKIGKSTYQFLLAQREEFEIAKIIKSILLARARTRTVQEFYHFCCHKCHRPIHKALIYKQPNKT